MTQGWMRKSDLAKHYRVNPSTIVRWSRDKADFPKPVELSSGVTAWPADKIEEYDRQLMQAGSK